MMAYVNAKRARRGATDGLNSREASPGERTPTEDEIRDANIKRNLQLPGGGGIFSIPSKDRDSAVLKFRGWGNDFSYSAPETYQVDAGPDGDINRAIVRKMIEIIRKRYNGDFNWESYRLQRVVVLSARLSDNAGLEDFLMQEFFITEGISAR